MLHLIPSPTSFRPLEGTCAIPAAPAARVPEHLDPRVSNVLHELFPGLHHIACQEAAPFLNLNPAPGPAITAALTALGRSGVPVYVFYRPGKPPVVLTEVLSVDEVRAVLADL